ncbi:hypothetical protein G7085_20385 [Tessaracoccus sp. HDW20]|nr:hypothetical protein [Tessaracoccus coleopterorum]NHB86086.1 hypothetical protein [Tessaracoccus coleopterorum]
MLTAWARGAVERIRTQGGIWHPWLQRYVTEDGNRWHLWSRKGRAKYMPPFPPGRSTPAFPRVGGAKIEPNKALLDPVTDTRAWYARWARRCLGLDGAAGECSPARCWTSSPRISCSEPSRPAAAPRSTPSSPRVSSSPHRGFGCRRRPPHLALHHLPRRVPRQPRHRRGARRRPCLHATCAGTLAPHPGDADNYYRRLYRSSEVRRVVAREHTSLLDTKKRLEYENAFKSSADDPTAPNVLVATRRWRWASTSATCPR